MQRFEIVVLDPEGVCVARLVVASGELEHSRAHVERTHKGHAILVRPLHAATDVADPLQGLRRSIPSRSAVRRERVKGWDDLMFK